MVVGEELAGFGKGILKGSFGVPPPLREPVE